MSDSTVFPCPVCRRACRCQRYGPRQLCWACWAEGYGGDRETPEPALDEIVERWSPRPLNRAEVIALRRSGVPEKVAEVIKRFAAVLGPPSATPEIVTGPKGERVRATYRTFRWTCPLCHGGEDDALGVYRPLTVNTDGAIFCLACGSEPEEIARAVWARQARTAA